MQLHLSIPSHTKDVIAIEVQQVEHMATGTLAWPGLAAGVGEAVILNGRYAELKRVRSGASELREP